jgi:hypothetical protein
LDVGNPCPKMNSTTSDAIPVLAAWEKLCTEIPKPDDFKFLYRNIGGGNSFTTAMSYFYESGLCDTGIGFCTKINNFYKEAAKRATK